MPWFFYLSLAHLFILFHIATTQSLSNACGSCSYPQAGYYGGWWTTADATSTASIEAVTLVVITDGDNTISTSTIFNFPSGAAVPVTNSAGYPVFTKTLTYGSTTITTALTWPTGYVSYQDGVSWTGAMPASTATGYTNATPAACSTVSTGAFSLYNTVISPIFPTPTPSPIAGPAFPSFDPASWYQWSFYEDTEADADCFAVYATSAFPDYATVLPSFPVYEYCQAPTASVCAPVALQSVAYLTVTSHYSGPSLLFPSTPVRDPSGVPATAESVIAIPGSATTQNHASATAAQSIVAITGPSSTISITRTITAAASSGNGATVNQMTSTSTVAQRPGGSTSGIRTSEAAAESSMSAAATSKHSAGNSRHSLSILVYTVAFAANLLFHTFG